MKVKNKAVIKKIIPFALYVLCFVAWAVWQTVIITKMEPGYLSSILDSVVVKTLVWVLPVLLLSRSVGKLKEIFSGRFPWLVLIVCLCLTTAFLYTLRLLNGLQNTHVIFDPMFILFSVSAGVLEELSFRGGFFRIQEKQLGYIPAAIINGVMFTLYHYPGLLYGDWRPIISLRGLLIFVMGVLFCLMYKKWRNLALNMAIHTVWDILSYFFCLVG